MIETSNITTKHISGDYGVQMDSYKNLDSPSFQDFMVDELKSQASVMTSGYDILTTRVDGRLLTQHERNSFEMQKEYNDEKKTKPALSLTEQIKIYKEDQLLSQPGGDNFNLEKDVNVIDYNTDLSSFGTRIGKDLKDAGGNFINIFRDIGLGAPIKYVDSDGSINEGKKVGFFGSIINFFKDIASGLSFGHYTPEGEAAPENAFEATKHFMKKIFVDAIFKDVVVGIPRSAIYISENAVFTCINLAETVPDATIGNFKAGQTATTEIFDDMQVLADFVTDIIPMGEANSRTHAFALEKGIKGLPFVHNLTTSEQKETNEENWKYVRNTPFRKAIETFATMIPIRM